MIGIYQISGPDRVYIGQSMDVESRLKSHFNQLRRRKHGCKKLQAAFNQHGAAKFVGLPVEYCSVDKLDARERFYMTIHKSHLYNTRITKVRMTVEC